MNASCNQNVKWTLDGSPDTTTLGPNSLTFSFSSGTSPEHNAGGRAFTIIITIYQTKGLEKYNARRIITRHTPLQKSYFGCYAVDRHICATVIITLIWLICMPLLSKFYHRKSMRAADEKLIINKLGP